MSLDEEMAEQVAKMPPPKDNGVRMRYWSPELEMLALVIDRQGEIIKAIIAAQGGKPPKIPPMPRPKTAMDDLRDPRKQHQRILAKVMIQQEDGSLVSAADAAARQRAGPSMAPG